MSVLSGPLGRDPRAQRHVGDGNKLRVQVRGNYPWKLPARGLFLPSTSSWMVVVADANWSDLSEEENPESDRHFISVGNPDKADTPPAHTRKPNPCPVILAGLRPCDTTRCPLVAFEHARATTRKTGRGLKKKGECAASSIEKPEKDLDIVNETLTTRRRTQAWPSQTYWQRALFRRGSSSNSASVKGKQGKHILTGVEYWKPCWGISGR